MVVVGGISELYQGDLDLGRIAVEALAGEELGPNVLLEDFHYGALAVAQRLQDVGPSALILIGAAKRDRPAATVTRHRVRRGQPSPMEFQRVMEDAATGYVTVDLVIDIAAGLGALPPRTIAIEVEPATTEPSESLSPAAEEALPGALQLVRTEIRRMPLFEVGDRVREALSEERLEPSPALDAMLHLLRELDRLDETGEWHAAFAANDRLRLEIKEGGASEGMTHLDWGLWWAVSEEIVRLQSLEASEA